MRAFTTPVVMRAWPMKVRVKTLNLIWEVKRATLLRMRWLLEIRSVMFHWSGLGMKSILGMTLLERS
ncbi:hypothetical protein POTOM_011316 [Populus tomentosa]|uniref:Uncharacterized protein n=1 Tax=Populus tomentosa TaxID=118781 RepID=A0A8X8AIV6_POPTO|nr:hypothetical protein POTOM_011316 [Populus tomentosa]